MKKILITGALGQIGSELVFALSKRYGRDNIVASDIRDDIYGKLKKYAVFAVADCTNEMQVERLITKYEIDTIYHLAAILSASAEEKPLFAWEVNMDCLLNVLESARVHHCSVFVPSSIGAFGPATPKINTPQVTIQRPTTIYGITKVAAELLCDYYYSRFRIDTRGVRFPGLISNVTEPGGGTTDYAVEIYYHAVLHGRYICPIQQGTKLDMMYMPDAIEAMIQLMEADPTKLINRNSYNIKTFSAAPEDFATAIRKKIPTFKIKYNVDIMRQRIADSWPQSMDTGCAEKEWNFSTKYDLDAVTESMIETIRLKMDERI